MHRVLILGGGFGGVATAHRLRGLLGDEADITLFDRQDQFMVGFRKSWAMVGLETAEAGIRSLHSLSQFGIRFVQGMIESFDPASRTASVDGKKYQADYVVVALGAELDVDAVPGFREHALNAYSRAGVAEASRRLLEFEGGRILIGIMGEPYKCPPAPYELAFLVREALEARGVEAEITVSTPKPMSLPILGDAGCSVIESRLESGGIAFVPNASPLRITRGEVLFKTSKRPYDLLLGIPPHRCPEVLVSAGLAEPGGWVKVDPWSLETGFPGVYAVGDSVGIMLANGKPHPKAGIFAEAQGNVVAARIAAEIKGEPVEALNDGLGHCYLEVGGGQAMLVRGRFLAEPEPEVELSEPSVTSLEDKRRFEAERLVAWFGVEAEPASASA